MCAIGLKATAVTRTNEQLVHYFHFHQFFNLTLEQLSDVNTLTMITAIKGRLR